MEQNEIAIKTLITFQECLKKLEQMEQMAYHIESDIKRIKKHIGLNDKIELR